MSATRTLSVRRLPGVLLPAALAVGAALALSGCGQAGLAGGANGHKITVEQLQKAADSLRKADPVSFGKVTNTQVLSVLLIAPYAERAASAAGKGVSDDAVKQAILAQEQQANNKNVHIDLLDSDALQALRGNIAFSQLDQAGQQAVVNQLKRAHVRVSPRYGSFDPATANITAPAPNWIQAAPKPAASPSASG